MDDTGEIRVSDQDRAAAHAALDRWLDACNTEGPAAHESGHGGYIGRMKLCAFVGDHGIDLRTERSFTGAL